MKDGGISALSLLPIAYCLLPTLLFDYFINRRPPQRYVRLLWQRVLLHRLLLIDRLGRAADVVLHGAGDVTDLAAEPAEEAFAGTLLSACVVTQPSAPVARVIMRVCRS